MVAAIGGWIYLVSCVVVVVALGVAGVLTLLDRPPKCPACGKGRLEVLWPGLRTCSKCSHVVWEDRNRWRDL